MTKRDATIGEKVKWLVEMTGARKEEMVRKVLSACNGNAIRALAEVIAEQNRMAGDAP